MTKQEFNKQCNIIYAYILIKGVDWLKKLVAGLKAMADEPRLIILVVLSLRGAVCVSHLQEAMKTPQPTVSRYLSILRNAGLLESERRGQWVYYKLSDEDGGPLLDLISTAARENKDSAKINRIMERLDRIEQQPALPESAEEKSSRSRKTAASKTRTKPARLRKEETNKKDKGEDASIGDEVAARLNERDIGRSEAIGIAMPYKSSGLTMPEKETTAAAALQREGGVLEATAMSEEALKDLVEHGIHPASEEAIPGKTVLMEKAVQTESDDATSVEELDDQSKKAAAKSKKSKKPQPPSLFDF